MTCPQFQFFLAWYSDENKSCSISIGSIYCTMDDSETRVQAADNPQAKSCRGITRRLRSRTRCTITPRHSLPVTLVPDICTHSMAGRACADFSHYSLSLVFTHRLYPFRHSHHTFRLPLDQFTFHALSVSTNTV